MKRDDKANVTWTAELIRRVSELWERGIPAREIAKRLRGGLTRNGIIGKMHRLNIDPGLSTSGRVPPPPKVAKIRASRARSHAAPRPPPSPSAPIHLPLPPPPDPPRKPGPYNLLALRSGDCKWPVNAPPRGEVYLFCGEAAFGSGPYCEYHARLGFSGKGTVRSAQTAGWTPRQAGF